MKMSVLDMFILLLGLFALIFVGYAMVHRKMVEKSATVTLSTLLMRISVPCTVFLSMSHPFDPQFLKDGLQLMFMSSILIFVYTFVGYGILKAMNIQRGHQGGWMVSCVFCNGAFMGYPIALAMFGEEGMALAAMLNVPVAILFYVLGIQFVRRDLESEATEKPKLWRVLCTEINFALAMGLLFYVNQWSLPAFCTTPITYLANLTTPISMLIVGMSLYGCEVSSIFRDKDVLSATAVRLLLFPAITYGLSFLMPWSSAMLPALLLVILSTPAPAAGPALVTNFGGNNETASKIVFLTSLLSLVTMPMWMSIL